MARAERTVPIGRAKSLCMKPCKINTVAPFDDGSVAVLVDDRLLSSAGAAGVAGAADPGRNRCVGARSTSNTSLIHEQHLRVVCPQRQRLSWLPRLPSWLPPSAARPTRLELESPRGANLEFEATEQEHDLREQRGVNLCGRLACVVGITGCDAAMFEPSAFRPCPPAV